MIDLSSKKPVGLYLHIPFCKGKCPYCDFYSVYPEPELVNEYTEALCREIKKANGIYDTVYFGGGTPSLLGAERIERIMSCIKTVPGCEVTLECNPSDTGGKDSVFDFKRAAECGVNRISMGLQSASDTERRSLGRRGGSEDVLRAMDKISAAGIENVSLDLMLGIPGQTEESLIESVRFCASAGAKHVSTYILKLEEGTVFYKRQNELVLPDEDETCELYLLAGRELRNRGYKKYEISNFAVPGYESRHNLKYWHCEEYLGIGAAAHSFINGKRFYYERSATDFIAGKPPVDDGSGGDEEEYIMLALRLSEGLREESFGMRFGHPLPRKMREKAQFFQSKGLLNAENGVWSMTERGFLLSNSVIFELIDAL